MPGGNKKGPENEGPRTGRGLGYCAGNDQPGYLNETEEQEIGFARGRRGAGWRNKTGRGAGRNRRGGETRGLGLGRGRGQGMGRRQGGR